MPLLEIRDLRKSYRAPDGEELLILDVPHLEIAASEQVGLEGSSGSGKTTLLNLIAGIQRADSGEILLDGRDMAALSEPARDRWRAERIGYVFQTFNLLQGYTALENVLLGMMFGPGPDPALARGLLEDLGLGDRQDHRPRQLSVGQQQRVALARALANRPRLVLADEPTGNLDVGHAREAIEVIRKCCRDHDAALLLVSHDAAVLHHFDRRVRIAELNRAFGGAGVS
jgi:putative ABC transport system ATP-binding protein